MVAWEPLGKRRVRFDVFGSSWLGLEAAVVTAADMCSISECEEVGEQGTATQGSSQPIPNTSGVTAQLPQHGPTISVLTVVFKMN